MEKQYIRKDARIMLLALCYFKVKLEVKKSTLKYYCSDISRTADYFLTIIWQNVFSICNLLLRNDLLYTIEAKMYNFKFTYMQKDKRSNSD